jgi:hypothetical protein
MTDLNDEAASWQPKFPADIDTMKAKLFEDIKEKFEAWLKSEPLTEPLTLVTGWHTITPQAAENLLRRNRPGANRKVGFSVVQYYARQMRNGDWKETGQGLIFDEHGVLMDGQHRLWACLYSGVPFTTFVLTGVKAIPRLFAYLDNSKPRNPATALQTAGFNGVSPTIAAILKIAADVEDDAYSASTAHRRPRMTPIEYLQLMDKYPNAKMAARLASADYDDAVAVVAGYKDVVGYTAMAIIDRFGQEEADNFFGELADEHNEYAPDSPITAMRKVMIADQKAKDPMKRHQVLGNLIKVFNAWHAGAAIPPKSRWVMLTNEVFPSLAAMPDNLSEEEADTADAAPEAAAA